MRNRRRIRTGGFSLVELMAVVVIMGILATTIAVATTSYLKRSRIAVTQVNIRQLRDQVVAFKLVNGKFPDDLKALVPEFIEDVSSIKDGWGNDFYFAAPGENAEVEIISAGPDGNINTADDNINSWELNRKDS